MSKSKTITTEKMLNMIRAMEETYLTIYKGHTEHSQEAIDAIRSLILAVGEWQLTCGISNLTKEQMRAIILNIRDFGEEKK